MENIKHAKFDDSFLLDGYYSIKPLGKLELLETLVYYNGPMMFTCKHPEYGFKLFATCIEELEVSPQNWETWYMMRHYTEDKLDELKNGLVTLKNFFEVNCIISCYSHVEDKHVRSYVVPLSDVPMEYIPSDVLLPCRSK